MATKQIKNPNDANAPNHITSSNAEPSQQVESENLNLSNQNNKTGNDDQAPTVDTISPDKSLASRLKAIKNKTKPWIEVTLTYYSEDELSDTEMRYE